MPTTTKILNNKTIHKENQRCITVDGRSPALERWRSCCANIKALGAERASITAKSRTASTH